MLATNDITCTGLMSHADLPEPNDSGIYVFNTVQCYFYKCSSSGVITSQATSLVVYTDAAGNYQALNISGDQFDMYRMNEYMKGGTYDAIIYAMTYTTRGIASLYIDDSLKGTADMYSAAAPVSTAFSISNFTVTGSKFHTIDIRQDTRNPSASQYNLLWTALKIYPHV
jgi:hypothetical protein